MQFYVRLWTLSLLAVVVSILCRNPVAITVATGVACAAFLLVLLIRFRHQLVIRSRQNLYPAIAALVTAVIGYFVAVRLGFAAVARVILVLGIALTFWLSPVLCLVFTAVLVPLLIPVLYQPPPPRVSTPPRTVYVQEQARVVEQEVEQIDVNVDSSLLTLARADVESIAGEIEHDELRNLVLEGHVVDIDWGAGAPISLASLPPAGLAPSVVAFESDGSLTVTLDEWIEPVTLATRENYHIFFAEDGSWIVVLDRDVDVSELGAPIQSVSILDVPERGLPEDGVLLGAVDVSDELDVAWCLVGIRSQVEEVEPDRSVYRMVRIRLFRWSENLDRWQDTDVAGQLGPDGLFAEFVVQPHSRYAAVLVAPLRET
jgi:hypothetical protein